MTGVVSHYFDAEFVEPCTLRQWGACRKQGGLVNQ